MLRKSIINAILAFKHENVTLSMVLNETKFYKRRSTAKMSHRWTGKGRVDYCSWLILQNVTLNIINTLKRQFFFKFTNGNCSITYCLTKRWFIPETWLMYKRFPEFKAFLAAYLRDGWIVTQIYASGDWMSYETQVAWYNLIGRVRLSLQPFFSFWLSTQYTLTVI